ncbi:ral GTPase-activating protein subunit beta [Phthorimaea operculella]|nr:ral GTPase-activating protein subunit beta [Phthorimaea operculella]
MGSDCDGMYMEWSSLPLEGGGRGVLGAVGGRDVVLAVVRQLASHEPSPLNTDTEVEWVLEVIRYGLSLPRHEHEALRDCVRVCCSWQTMHFICHSLQVEWVLEVIRYGLSLPLHEHEALRDCVRVCCSWQTMHFICHSLQVEWVLEVIRYGLSLPLHEHEALRDCVRVCCSWQTMHFICHSLQVEWVLEVIRYGLSLPLHERLLLVEWVLELIRYGLSLPLHEHEALRDCVRVCCSWQTMHFIYHSLQVEWVLEVIRYGLSLPLHEHEALRDCVRVEWVLEVIRYGLSLPLHEHEALRDCVRVCCSWLSPLLPPAPPAQPPPPAVPPPVAAAPARYARKILKHLHNLFVPRPNESGDLISKQAVLCHRVLRLARNLAGNANLGASEWRSLLLLLLSAASALLSPPAPHHSAAEQLCERVLCVLFEVWILACHRCFPSPPLWRTLREQCIRWRHRAPLTEQWTRASLCLTARLLKHMYGPMFPAMPISEEDANLIPADMSAEAVMQSWYRILHTIGNPVDLCRPHVISQTPDFLQYSITAEDGARDPSQHPCLQALPSIFHKAMKGVAAHVDAFLGFGTSKVNRAPNRSYPSPLALRIPIPGCTRVVGLGAARWWMHGPAPGADPPPEEGDVTPPAHRRLAKSFSVSNKPARPHERSMCILHYNTGLYTWRVQQARQAAREKYVYTSIGCNTGLYTWSPGADPPPEEGDVTPPAHRRLAKSFSVSNKPARPHERSTPRTSLIGLTSSRPASVAPTTPPNSITSTVGEAEKPPLAPLRPKVNSIFHLFGEWLFEAALIGTTPQYTNSQQRSETTPPPSISDSQFKLNMLSYQPAAMIGREDREDALLKSALQADERVRVVSEHLTECLMLLEEAPNPEDKELVEGDVSQCLELAQDIAQAAADISRRRDGKEKPFRGKVGQGLQVPLPPVTVPVFAGDYADWPAFEDLYSSVVHTRTDITPAYKMAQLMSRLHGEPHELLTHLAVSDSNYEVAWKILTDRYRNKRLIIDRLASPPAERNGRSIRAATWGKSSDHLPTYEDLKSFLEAESRRVDVQAGEAPRKETSAPRHPERPGAPARGGNSGQPRRYNTALESGCAYCRRQATGWQRVRSLLRSGFRGDGVWHSRGVGVFGAWGRIRCECPSSTNCRYCQGAHHPLLCMNRSGGAGAALDRISEGACPPREGATLPTPSKEEPTSASVTGTGRGTSTDGAHLPKDVGTIPTTAAGAGLGKSGTGTWPGHPSQVRDSTGGCQGSTRQPPGYMQYSAGLSHLVGSQDPRIPRLCLSTRGYRRNLVWRPQDLPEGDPVLYGSVLSEVLQRFWESEEPPTADRRKPEDDECELFYQYNTARCPSGRFVTRLPFLPNRPALGSLKQNGTLHLSSRLRSGMRLYAHWLESSRRNILKRRSGCSGMDVES